MFADETVTFIAPKPVHLLPATEPAVGRLTVVDIGVEIDRQPVVERLDPDDVAGLWPVPGPADDKYSRGVLGIVAGGEGYTGARCWRSRRRSARARGWCVTSAHRRRPCSFARRCLRPSSARAGCRRGSSGRASTSARPARTRGPRPPPGRRSPARPVSWTRAAWTCSTPRAAARAEPPTLLTPHAGELARLLDPTRRPRRRRPRERGRPAARARPGLADLTNSTVLLKGATTLVVPPGRRVGRCAPRPTRRRGWRRPGRRRARRAARHPARRRASPPDSRAPRGPGARHGRRPRQPRRPGAGAEVAHAIPGAVAHLLRRARDPGS